jgi:hypothetical protein
MCINNDASTTQRIKGCLACFVCGWPGGFALWRLNFPAAQFACHHSHDFTLLGIAVDTHV